jgi:hypothetical protein
MNVPPGINTNPAPIAGLVKLLSCAAASMTKDEASISMAIMTKKRNILFIIHFLGLNICSAKKNVYRAVLGRKLSQRVYECKCPLLTRFFKKQSFVQP